MMKKDKKQRSHEKIQGVCIGFNRFKFKFYVKFWVSKPKIQTCVKTEVWFESWNCLLFKLKAPRNLNLYWVAN
jgi:hypothetical protein